MNHGFFGNPHHFFFRLIKRKNIKNKPIRRIRRKSTRSTVNVAGSNPLPSETPSPELGAGPGLVVATTVPQKVLAKTKSSSAIPTILFKYFSSCSDLVLSLI
ncbi:MAG: hypothetical protein V1915_02290 [Candidatus Bathyarchaeota archaeon]